MYFKVRKLRISAGIFFLAGNFCQTIRISEILFWQTNVANLPNLSEHMSKSSHMIGGLLGHVYKHDPFKCAEC